MKDRRRPPLNLYNCNNLAPAIETTASGMTCHCRVNQNHCRLGIRGHCRGIQTTAVAIEATARKVETAAWGYTNHCKGNWDHCREYIYIYIYTYIPLQRG